MCLLNLKMTCQSAHYRRRAYPTGRPSWQFPEIKYTHRGHAKSLCTNAEHLSSPRMPQNDGQGPDDDDDGLSHGTLFYVLEICRRLKH